MPKRQSTAFGSKARGTLGIQAHNKRRETVGNKIMAEGVGFEPTIRSPVYTLSRRAPSTTRPPLHMRHCGPNIVMNGLGSNMVMGHKLTFIVVFPVITARMRLHFLK